MKLKISILCSFILLMNLACQKQTKNIEQKNAVNRQGIDGHPSRKADLNIQNSFNSSQLKKLQKASSSTLISKFEDQSDMKVNDLNISISKSALGKEFLFMTNLVNQSVVPQFNGGKSKVVIFKKNGSELIMLESLPGNSIDKDIPQQYLITKFKILEETSEMIVFNFNEGMNQVFTANDWYAQEEQGTSLKKSDNDAAIEIKQSYLDSVQFKGNTLVISQIAQVPVDETKRETWKVIYYLEPYNPDPTFEPTISPEHTKVGFFEVSPVLMDDGSTVVRASKWNEKNIITYAISANTPAIVQETIKEGVLYWNKAFGKEVFKVVQLEDKNIVAPTPEYNMIQWANWDTASYAYADAQMDPRSGEILHAQIFFPSGWLVYTRQAAEKLLRSYHQQQSEESNLKKRFLDMKGLLEGPHCDNKIKSKYFENLEQVLSYNPSDEQIKKLSLDYIRDVIAHEVGHTLGLRHNFVASVGATYKASEVGSILSDYLSDKLKSDVRSSSSVMDYTGMLDSAISGHQELYNDSVLPYDQKAIDVLYLKKQFGEVTKETLYCGDDSADQSMLFQGYMDCVRFDSGNSTLDYYVKANKDLFSSLALNSIYTFITAKNPINKGDLSKPVEAVNLCADCWVTKFDNSYRMNFLALLNTAWTVEARSNFGFVSSINENEVREVETKLLTEKIKNVGGIKKIFFSLDDNFVRLNVEKFKNLLNDSELGRGTFAGKPYVFTEAEKSVMTKTFEKALNKFVQLANEKILDVLGYTSKEPVVINAKPINPKLIDADFLSDLSALLLDNFKKFVLSRSQDTVHGNIVTTDGKSKEVYLPKYQFALNLRKKATGLLAEDRSEQLGWLIEQQNEARESFDQEFDLLPFEISKIDPVKTSTDVRKWILEQKQIESMLPEPIKW